VPAPLDELLELLRAHAVKHAIGLAGCDSDDDQARGRVLPVGACACTFGARAGSKSDSDHPWARRVTLPDHKPTTRDEPAWAAASRCDRQLAQLVTLAEFACWCKRRLTARRSLREVTFTAVRRALLAAA
jgi:hypothetical protein